MTCRCFQLLKCEVFMLYQYIQWLEIEYVRDFVVQSQLFEDIPLESEKLWCPLLFFWHFRERGMFKRIFDDDKSLVISQHQIDMCVDRAKLLIHFWWMSPLQLLLLKKRFQKLILIAGSKMIYSLNVFFNLICTVINQSVANISVNFLWLFVWEVWLIFVK